MLFSWEKGTMSTKSHISQLLTKEYKSSFRQIWQVQNQTMLSPSDLPYPPSGQSPWYLGGTKSHVETPVVGQEPKVNEKFKCWWYITHSTKALPTIPKVLSSVKLNSFLFYPTSIYWESAYTLCALRESTIVILQAGWWKWFEGEKIPFLLKASHCFQDAYFAFFDFQKGNAIQKKKGIFVTVRRQKKKGQESIVRL